MIILSVLCACAGLIWSSGVAAADSGHRSGTPLGSGPHTVGGALAGARNKLLGTHVPNRPATSRPASNRPAAKPVDDGAVRRATHTATSLIPANPRVRITHPEVTHPRITHPNITHPRLTDGQHHPKVLKHAAARTLISTVARTSGDKANATSRTVHLITSRVRPTGERLAHTEHRHHGNRQADVTSSLGDLTTSVGGTTTAAGSVVDGTAGILHDVAAPDRLTAATGDQINRVSGVVGAGDDLIGSTGALLGATSGTLTTTVDRTIGAPVGGTVGGTILDTVTNTVTQTAGDTVIAVGGVVGTTISDTGTVAGPIAAVWPPYAQDHGLPPHAAASDPAQHATVPPDLPTAQQPTANPAQAARPPAATWLVVAPLTTLLMIIRADTATVAEHAGARQPSTQDAAAVLPLDLDGGGPVPGPGQLPQPTGETVTASSSSGSWHEHGVLRAASNRTTGTLPGHAESFSMQAQAAPYDPGYSPD